MLNHNVHPSKFTAYSSRYIIIPVMGATGVGKSTFINLIMGGEPMVVDHEMEPCTSDIAMTEVDPSRLAHFPLLKGRNLFLVDTPGFDDTYQDDVDTLERIAKWIKESDHKHILGGVIYLHDISADRSTGATKRNLLMFNKLCRHEEIHNIVLGLTKTRRAVPDDARKREDGGKTSHWKFMIDRGVRIFHVTDAYSSLQAWELFSSILDGITKYLAYQIPPEMANNNSPDESGMLGLPSAPQHILEPQREMGQSSNDFLEPLTISMNPDIPPRDNRPQRDIVIPVVGPVGCGKSSFINAILKHNEMAVAVDHQQESCTTEVFTAAVGSSQIPFSRECLKNRRLILVDTPGFDSTDLDDWDVLEKIITYLQQSHRDHLLLGGVIYLQDISLDRVSGGTKRCLDMLNKACGVDGLKNVVLVATKWSRLSPDEAETRFRRLKEVHWKSMVDMGAQAFRIDEGGSSPASLLNAVLERFEEEWKENAGKKQKGGPRDKALEVYGLRARLLKYFKN